MNHTNEQLARIYGAYMGCEVANKKALKGRPMTLIMVDSRNGTLNAMDEEMKLAFSGDIGNYHLLLTPLSRITDEHALELGKKYGWDEDFNPFGGSGAPLPDDEVIDVVKYHVKWSTFEQKEVDTLRKRGYDCGFEEIASLIEARIALDKTTLNDTEHGK